MGNHLGPKRRKGQGPKSWQKKGKSSILNGGSSDHLPAIRAKPKKDQKTTQSKPVEREEGDSSLREGEKKGRQSSHRTKGGSLSVEERVWN